MILEAKRWRREGGEAADRVFQESRGVKRGIKWGVNEPVNAAGGDLCSEFARTDKVTGKGACMHIASLFPPLFPNFERERQNNFVLQSVTPLSSLDYGRDKREENFSALPIEI